MNEQTLYFSWPALKEETANYLPHIHASVGETLLVQLPSRQGPADNTCLGHYPCLSGNASQIRTWGICGSVSKACITEWESRWLSVCLRCVSEITFAKLFSSGSSKGKGGRSGLTQSHCGGRGERVWCSQLSKTHKLSCRYTERRAGLCRRAVCNQIGRAAHRLRTLTRTQYASRVRAYRYETLSHTHTVALTKYQGFLIMKMKIFT